MSNGPNSWPEGEDFIEELFSLTKPSSSKINSIADSAVKLYRQYKLVVHALEKFVRKSTRDTRLLGLYVIDAVIRRSRSKFGSLEKDVFTQRLSTNMMLTFAKLIEVRSFEMERVAKILSTWRTKGLFPLELQEEMEAIFQSAKENPIDDDEEEEESRERTTSPVPPAGEEARSASPKRASALPLPPPPPSQPTQQAQQALPSMASRDPRARDPRRPMPAAAPSPSSGSSLDALANLQSMIHHGGAAPQQTSLPPPPAPAPAPAPLPPPPPPPPAMDWDYDDEDDDDEDEDARKEKLRIKLEQEKIRMDALVSTPTPVPTPLLPPPPPPPPAPESPLAAHAGERRSRFSAPHSASDVAAAEAAQQQSLGLGRDNSYDRPSSSRRRSRSRSRSPPRGFSLNGGSDSYGGSSRSSTTTSSSRSGNNSRGSQGPPSPGFVILPSEYQDSPALIKVLTTTLWIVHDPLEALGIDFNGMRTALRERYGSFGLIDSINSKDSMSFVKFRTRRDASRAKNQTERQPLLQCEKLQVRWAKPREVEKDVFQSSTGEGSIESDHAALAQATTEEPDLEVDIDFRDRHAPRGGDRDRGGRDGRDRDQDNPRGRPPPPGTPTGGRWPNQQPQQSPHAYPPQQQQQNGQWTPSGYSKGDAPPFDPNNPRGRPPPPTYQY